MKEFKTIEEKKAFELGVSCVRGYILYCLGNYILELNIAGIVDFSKNLVDFVNLKSNYIPNTKELTFEKYCQLQIQS